MNQYNEHGYLHLPIHIPSDRIDEIKQALEHLRHSEATNGYGILRNNIYQEVQILRDTIDDYNLGQLACEILDLDEVLLFQDNLIWKPTGTDQSIAWHQDFSYWPLSHPHGITFWIALDDVNAANGCMQFIPGSHKWGECQPTNFITGQVPPEHTDLLQLPIAREISNAVNITVEQGRGVAHHPLLAHMSSPNSSQMDRRGWSLTWVAPTVSWDPSHAPHPYTIYQNIKKYDSLEGPHYPRFYR